VAVWEEEVEASPLPAKKAGAGGKEAEGGQENEVTKQYFVRMGVDVNMEHGEAETVAEAEAAVAAERFGDEDLAEVWRQ